MLKSDVLQLKSIVREYWEAACAYEGISPGARFVVFSKDNLYEAVYQQAMTAYLAAMQAYLAAHQAGA